jgi:probable rRNA maturation factor
MIVFQRPVAAVRETALARFLARSKRAVGLRGAVTVMITQDREMRLLNKQFRKKDYATDVLSFPAARTARALAGDLAISAQIAARNARAFGHSTEEEIKILILHGILHLAGYDHERDQGEMRRREIRLRQDLGLPVSLIERTERARGAGGARTTTTRTKPRPRRRTR